MQRHGARWSQVIRHRAFGVEANATHAIKTTNNTCLPDIAKKRKKSLYSKGQINVKTSSRTLIGTTMSAAGLDLSGSYKVRPPGRVDTPSNM